MKAIALTFNYDLEKMKSNGRFWVERVYDNKVLSIFKYSAASYATFIDKHPEVKLTIYTNDVELMKKCMEEYNINYGNITYVDYTEKINESKKHPFMFQPLCDWLYDTADPNDYVIKIDNDLIWNSSLPTFDEDKDVLVWKFERIIRHGDPRMGEVLVCQKVCNNIDFKGYNLGVLGVPKGYPMKEFHDVCEEMTRVDIKPVSDLGVNIWHVCDQTAHNWVFHKHNYNILEMYPYVDHYFDNKLMCIERAKYLIKQ